MNCRNPSVPLSAVYIVKHINFAGTLICELEIIVIL